jgi:hypothetical protein
MGMSFSIGPYLELTNFLLQLYLVLCMHRWRDNQDSGKALQVSYMIWKDFFDAIMDPKAHEETWNIFRGVDCLIGGVDMAMSYLYMTQAYFMHINNSDHVAGILNMD